VGSNRIAAGGTAGLQPRRPDRRLQGKVAIVTGAGSSAEGFGTGKATAILFTREGARVALVDNIADRVADTERIIIEEGGSAIVQIADISSEADCRRVVETAVGQWGRLDVLDNNVGIALRGSVVDTPESDWDRVLAVNLMAIVRMSRHAVPAMEKSGGGSIINISSISPRRPYRATPYSVSKGAVDALSLAMAVDHGAQGIRVNSIAPGPLHTPRAVARATTDEQCAMRRDASPLGIEGSGWDIGWAAVFLASDESSYVTGTVLTVDGGVAIQGNKYR
jgi:NAD(P)-dependent dehydrogenase (short-subunit alcohol dehydrogenase family)